MAERRTLQIALKAALALVVASIALALMLSDVTAEEARTWLRASGAWGPVTFVGAFATLQPLGVAAHAFIVAASVVWDPWLAFLLSWLGALGAGAAAFGFARYLGHDWVQARVPKRLHRFDERLESQGFRTVLLMRLLFFTFGPMQLMFGVSRVRFIPFMAASAIGLVPLIAMETLIGGSVVAWLLG